MPSNPLKYNTSCPYWLEPNATADDWIVDEKKVEAIRDVFMLAWRGASADSIAEWIPIDVLPPSGKDWDASKVLYLLKNIAVIGQKRSTKTGEIVEGWYPRVIDRDVFETVGKRLKTKQKIGAAGSDDVQNLFAGRLFCPCGGALRVSDAGLYCKLRWDGKSKDCRFERMDYSTLEAPLAKAILDAAQISRRTPVVEDSMRGVRVALADAEQSIEALTNAITKSSGAASVPTIVANIERKQKEIDALRAELEAGPEKTHLEHGELLTWEQHERSKHRDAVKAPQDVPGRSALAPSFTDLRVRLRSEIYRVTERITVASIPWEGVRHVDVEGDVNLKLDIKV